MVPEEVTPDRLVSLTPDVEDLVDFVVVISADLELTLVIVVATLDPSDVIMDVVIVANIPLMMTKTWKLIPKPFGSKCLKSWTKT